MEYCPGGGVIDLMNRRLQQRLTEPEILKIFSDVAEALSYMHYCNPPVLHRDLKVENILILNQDSYKLCDFGSASLSKGAYLPNTLRDLQKLEDDIQRHTTLQYRAPEMIDVYQKKPINEKADIWAMGVLLYKLCYYTTPFEEEGQLAILNARYSIPSSPVFSEGMRRLIISMLQEDQNCRPNIYQVLNSVCHLRGLECPIRDIYSEPITTPPFAQQQQQQQHQYQSTPTSAGDGSIFEKVPSPSQELPHITPMRRGRPTKSERMPADNPVQVNSASATDAFDPFDPAHVGKSSTPPATATNASIDTDSTTSHASFQNSFMPPESSKSSSSSSKTSPPPRVQSAPITQHVTPKPQMATKILQTQPSSPMLKSFKEDFKPPVEGTEDKEGDSDDDMPQINRGVSSSIEARFMAIKKASRNSGSHTTKPPATTSAPKKSKPAPPPKPARFRSQQTNQQVPSVDDFEHKFPSLEELDKSIS
ncbi:kinase-like domain-containing protein [Parasitella parasitica]|nr:kinase-like domain-containing protein [Parasitella parasitica]